MVSYSCYKLVADLQSEGYGVLLTGEGVIEVLSGGLFETGDWDIVPDAGGSIDEITRALRERGYERLGGSWYIREGGYLRNPGEFIQAKYQWGKTATIKVGSLELKTVALEWLFVDRVSKCRGSPTYCEQALFLSKYASEEDYNWDEELVDAIADRKNVPEPFLEEEWIERRASG